MKISYLAGMNASASGLAAQRAAMDAAAENLANVRTTRTATGEPYRRKVVAVEAETIASTVREPAGGPSLPLTRTEPGHVEAASDEGRAVERNVTGVRATVAEDPSDFPQIYDPGHPDAGEDGMVRMPNVDTAREMVTLMVASRAYEANIAALQASRRLAEATLNLAR